MKNLKLILILVAVLIAALLITIAVKSSTNPEPADQTEDKVSESGQVTITSAGFGPGTIKIKQGSAVVWTNNDTNAHWIASDPHPVHDGLASFDAKRALLTGETYSFTFTQTGTFTYHDHLNPFKFFGTVVVE